MGGEDDADDDSVSLSEYNDCSSCDDDECSSCSDDEIYISNEHISSSSSTSSSSSSSSSSCEEEEEEEEEEGEEDNNDDNNNNNNGYMISLIILLSEINIFGECGSLARIIKFICTLIFFIALHCCDGNSAAKMIVKIGVSIIYLAAMFGHRINEWKQCIDAETNLRKQQWTKQRDKERQKRKDRLQKILKNPDCKKFMIKKQRKLQRDTFYRQEAFDWRSKIRVMINHAESAFLQNKWEMAEIYFSRLLWFLMENENDPNVFLNERKRASLKINRRWKSVFNDYYTIPIAKMFSRRAYCLCKLKNNINPHSAPSSNILYNTISHHLELALKDLNIAISLREISPIYQKFKD